MRLLPPPERHGRVGLYGTHHVQRLQLIARLQRRGYSLAGIRDLLAAWESGTDLTTLLGVDQGQPVLDEMPLRLTRAELLRRLPELEDSIDRASQAGLVRPHGPDSFIVRSPALLSLATDWVRAGVPLVEALDVVQALTGELGALGRTLAGLIVDRIWPSAASSPGELPGLLQRGRPLLLQAVVSTLADRLGAALAQRAEESGDRLLAAALDGARVGAVTDSEGTIHRPGGHG